MRNVFTLAGRSRRYPRSLWMPRSVSFLIHLGGSFPSLEQYFLYIFADQSLAKDLRESLCRPLVFPHPLCTSVFSCEFSCLVFPGLLAPSPCSLSHGLRFSQSNNLKQLGGSPHLFHIPQGLLTFIASSTVFSYYVLSLFWLFPVRRQI